MNQPSPLPLGVTASKSGNGDFPEISIRISLVRARLRYNPATNSQIAAHKYFRCSTAAAKVFRCASKFCGQRQVVPTRVAVNGNLLKERVGPKICPNLCEGTGLGLSISHDIVVKQHGGSIEVDTEPGEFTEVRVILPRAAALLPERS